MGRGRHHDIQRHGGERAERQETKTTNSFRCYTKDNSQRTKGLNYNHYNHSFGLTSGEYYKVIHLAVSGHPCLLISYTVGLCKRNNCHESSFYLSTALLSSIQIPFEERTCFIKCEGPLGQFFVIMKRFFLLSQEFFHQSSFKLTKNCFINPAST